MGSGGGFLYELFDRLQIASELTVVFVCEALEVDVVGVDVGQQFRERLRRDVAVGDGGVFQPAFFYLGGTVAYKFPADERFVVGISDPDVPAAAQFVGERGKFRRRNAAGRDVSLPRARDLVVLAEGAVHVAAEGTDGEDEAAVVEFHKRFFLNRVERSRSDLSVAHADAAASVVTPRAAEAGFALF